MVQKKTPDDSRIARETARMDKSPECELKNTFGDFFITPDEEMKLIRSMPAGRGRGAMEFSREIGEATGAPLTVNKIDVECDGASAFKKIIKDVRGAVNNVYVFTYSLAIDSIGKEFAHELILAKRNNPDLDIKFAVDKMGCILVGCKNEFARYANDPKTLKSVWDGICSKEKAMMSLPSMLSIWVDVEKVYRINVEKRASLEALIREKLTADFLKKMNPLFDIMEQSGIEVDIRDYGLNTDHRKFSSTDGNVAFLGGRNIGDDYFTENSWIDHTFRVEGPIASLGEKLMFNESKIKHFHLDDGENTAYARLLVNEPNEGMDPVRDYIDDYPDPQKKQFSFAVYRVIEEAKEHIYIEHSYLSDKGVVERLKKAAGRHVKIVIIRSEPENLYIGVSNYRVYEQLQGLPQIEMLDIPYVSHAKVINADGIHSLVGSGNLIKSSLHAHGEIGMLISGKSPVQRQLNALRKTTIDIASRSNGIRQKILSTIMRPAMYWAIHRGTKKAVASGLIT